MREKARNTEMKTENRRRKTEVRGQRSEARMLIALCAMLLAPGAFAQTTVRFDLAMMGGVTNDTTITIRAVNNPVTWNGRIYWLPVNGTNITTSGGSGFARLIPTNYRVNIAGVPTTWPLPVPDSTNVLNAADLATNLPTAGCTNVWATAGQLAGVAGGTNANTLWVDKNGNDANVGNFDRPKLTISNAVAAASAGYTVVVNPGTYLEHNLLKRGVNYHLMPGVLIDWTNSVNSSGDVWGIFDDRPVGATTNIISGEGILQFFTGTNYSGFGSASSGPDFGIMGPVVTTNALTRMSARVARVRMGMHSGSQYRSAICSFNSAESHFDVDAIEDSGAAAVPFLTVNDVYDPMDPETGGPFITNYMGATWSGIMWGLGDVHFAARKITGIATGVYAIWGHVSGSGNSANLYATVNYMGGTIYIDGPVGNPNYKSWIDLKLIEGPGGNVQTVGYYCGKHYLRAEKIQGIATTCIVVDNDTQAWIESEKVTALGGQSWLLNGSSGVGATTHAHILHWEHGGGNMAVGIVNYPRSTLFLDGGYARLTNQVALQHNGGSTFANNFTFDNQSGSQQAIEVLTNGLTLQGCNILAPPTKNALYASTPQTVEWYWSSANKTNSPNITLTQAIGYGYYAASNVVGAVAQAMHATNSDNAATAALATNAVNATNLIGAANAALTLTDAAGVTNGKFATARFYGTHPTVANQVVLGSSADVVLPGGIAFGGLANASGTNSIAIGFNAQAGSGNNSSVFGANAAAFYADSTAIGQTAASTKTNQISLGLVNGEVNIPGNLQFSTGNLGGGTNIPAAQLTGTIADARQGVQAMFFSTNAAPLTVTVNTNAANGLNFGGTAVLNAGWTDITHTNNAGQVLYREVQGTITFTTGAGTQPTGGTWFTNTISPAFSIQPAIGVWMNGQGWITSGSIGNLIANTNGVNPLAAFTVGKTSQILTVSTSHTVAFSMRSRN